jgi:hypothetical protein
MGSTSRPPMPSGSPSEGLKSLPWILQSVSVEKSKPNLAGHEEELKADISS